MSDIKGIIDDIGISALENNIKIAAIAVISNSGKLIHQTENFDLEKQVNILLSAMKEEKSIKINDLEFKFQVNPEGIIGTNKARMGYLILVPFDGGVLVSYALPQAEPTKALSFLKTYAGKLAGND
ncbi:MAG: hypothetical protein P8Y23_14115 [Candidatus Lokiarchaeota archaeon]|jgi:hypothetical protein